MQFKGKWTQVHCTEFNGDMNAMREEADRLRNQLGSGVVVLASGTQGAKILVATTKDLAGKTVHAGNMVRALAKHIGGGGGGRPDMAQAGVKPAGIPNALAAVADVIASRIEHRSNKITLESKVHSLLMIETSF